MEDYLGSPGAWRRPKISGSPPKGHLASSEVILVSELGGNAPGTLVVGGRGYG